MPFVPDCGGPNLLNGTIALNSLQKKRFKSSLALWADQHATLRYCIAGSRNAGLLAADLVQRCCYLLQPRMEQMATEQLSGMTRDKWHLGLSSEASQAWIRNHSAAGGLALLDTWASLS